MCNLCTPGGWHQIVCDLCGRGSQAVAVVCLGTDDGSEFPFTQTALCRDHWERLGIGAALEHNASIRAAAGVALPEEASDV